MKTKLLGLIACMALLSVLPAGATTYTYEGSPYTQCGGAGFCLPYFEVRMTGTVTFNFDTSAATGTFDLSSGDIAFLMMNPGRGYLDVEILDPRLSASFQIVSGLITSWSIRFMEHAPVFPGCGASCVTFSNYLSSPNGDSFSWAIEGGIDGFGSASSDSGGVWTEQGMATPLPAAFPLFASGLGVMGFIGWRRRRRAAKAVT